MSFLALHSDRNCLNVYLHVLSNYINGEAHDTAITNMSLVLVLIQQLPWYMYDFIPPLE